MQWVWVNGYMEAQFMEVILPKSSKSNVGYEKFVYVHFILSSCYFFANPMF